MRLCVRHSEADAEAVDGEIERLTLGRYDTDLERWEIFQPGEADDAICVETLRFSLWMIVGAAAPEPAAAGGIGAWWVLVGVGAALFGAGGATLLVRHRGSRRDRPGSVPDTEEEEAPTAHPPVDGTAAQAAPVESPPDEARRHLRHALLAASRAVASLRTPESSPVEASQRIATELDAALEPIARCTARERIQLLTRLRATGAEMERVLDRELDRSIASAQVLVVNDLMEARRISRLAQLTALTIQGDETLPAGPTDWSQTRVSISGRAEEVRGRTLTIAGARVVIARDIELERSPSPGDLIEVAGELGPGATLFATRVRVIRESEPTG